MDFSTAAGDRRARQQQLLLYSNLKNNR